MNPFADQGYFLLRWFHFLAGVTWIGMLYYLNFAQTPFLAKAEGPVKSAVIRGLHPIVLWYFRWGAMLTFLTGVLTFFILWHGQKQAPSSPGMTLLLTGMLMGTVMWFNVWFVIWPRQKLVIQSAEETAAGRPALPGLDAAAARAGVASRTNVLLSVPMLLLMGGRSMAGGLGWAAESPLMFWIVALILIGAIEFNALSGPALPKQPLLKTVKGVLHSGFALAIVFFVAGALLLRG
jgi:uncharacterized membrane protein